MREGKFTRHIDLIKPILTLYHVKLTGRMASEQKRFDLRSLPPALRNLRSSPVLSLPIIMIMIMIIIIIIIVVKRE